jgi:hypothetical protein
MIQHLLKVYELKIILCGVRGARSLFNYLVPMLQDNKLKKKKQKKRGHWA